MFIPSKKTDMQTLKIIDFNYLGFWGQNASVKVAIVLISRPLQVHKKYTYYFSQMAIKKVKTQSKAVKSKPKDKAKAKSASFPKVITPEVIEAQLEQDEDLSENKDLEESEVIDGEWTSNEKSPENNDNIVDNHSDESALVPITDSSLPEAQLDLLKQYIRDISKYSLLSPDEEYKLAIQLKSTGDVEAARKLVTANLRLVVKIAMEYRSTYQNVMDLIQEGNVGLMKAVSKFDPSKGAKLSYYASWWIKSYILKYILDNFRLVRVGTTQAQKKLFFHLMKEKERLLNLLLLKNRF